MPVSTQTITCVACSIFKSELDALKKQGRIDLPIHYLNSMLHIFPETLQRCLTTTIDSLKASGDKVLVLYGDCHAYMNEIPEGSRRVCGLNCMDIFLGHDRYRQLRKEGVFFLLPEWTKQWRNIFENQLALSLDLAKDMMMSMHTKLLYLDTGHVPVPMDDLKEASETLGLPWDILKIDTNNLLMEIKKTLKELTDDA